ncbi:hypothetical protein CLHOM_04370 [Clostridium homopropionicum DSM 5847]|uniref:Uncharacterized protein n=1 Tax=Clostridium homopropionicum DSM 5847 TaxID=1121318 RepID=A0A0L6ZED6_9CLOT|nr:hypothetical protein [Clostridium homopropionicum]KOA21307.1 hypothetical protein CLHOM_04370 [Clostridium homopropionicum DSM 5847]SFG30639.1 hypothetical protein SAMN04488501_107184 [Clostridium homopropionicum]
MDIFRLILSIFKSFINLFFNFIKSCNCFFKNIYENISFSHSKKITINKMYEPLLKDKHMQIRQLNSKLSNVKTQTQKLDSELKLIHLKNETLKRDVEILQNLIINNFNE